MSSYLALDLFKFFYDSILNTKLQDRGSKISGTNEKILRKWHKLGSERANLQNWTRGTPQTTKYAENSCNSVRKSETTTRHSTVTLCQVDWDSSLLQLNFLIVTEGVDAVEGNSDCNSWFSCCWIKKPAPISHDLWPVALYRFFHICQKWEENIKKRLKFKNV